MTGQPGDSRRACQKLRPSHADESTRRVPRCLEVTDAVVAEKFLLNISHYNFSRYCLAIEQPRHSSQDDVKFEQVCFACGFNMALRDLFKESVKVPEIYFLAVLAYEVGQCQGPLGYIDRTKYFDSCRPAEGLLQLQAEADRCSKWFVGHFRNNYTQFPDLPIWMAIWVMSFGVLSGMFQGLNRDDRRPIGRCYRVQPRDLVTTFHHLRCDRNLGAHHSRLWAIKPMLPRGQAWQPPRVPSNARMFLSLFLLYHLITRCPAADKIVLQLRDRLKQHLSPSPARLNSLGKMVTWSNRDRHPVWG